VAENIGNMFCRLCWIDFNVDEAAVECAGPCGSRFHRDCVDVTGDVAQQLLATDGGYLHSGLEWYCRTCRQLYRLQVYFEVAISEAPTSHRSRDLGFTAHSRLAARKLYSLIEFVACVCVFLLEF